MGEFNAWALTGQVGKLQVWSAPGEGRGADGEADGEQGSVRIATRIVKQQKFVIRSRSGREMPVHLKDSLLAFEDGQLVTAAWAAREGAKHGHCVYVKNHSIGAAERLEANLAFLRSEVKAGKIAGFGLLAAVPAACALFAWLLIPGSIAQIDATLFLAGVAIALVVLFMIGAIVAKVVFEYLRSEDDEKIWIAVTKAITLENQQQQQQAERRPYPHLAYRA
jgi:hypothetical protein